MTAGLDFWAFVGVTAGIYAILGLSLQLQLGFAGLMNFGVVAFMAIGAYSMAILVVKDGLALWLASLIAIMITSGFGLLIALPTLRLRADYLAVTTFAFAEIVRYVALNLSSLTGGSQGTVALAGANSAAFYNTSWLNVQHRVQVWLHPLLGSHATLNMSMLVIVWVVLVVLIVIVQYMVHSPWGRVLRAIRDEEDAAAALGKNVFRFKLQVLGIAGAIGAVAGLLYAFENGFFGPSDFDPLTTLIAFMVVILGGTARNWGVTVGALIFSGVYAITRFLNFPPFDTFSSSDRAYLRLIVVGVILIGLMAFRPQGIFGRKQELADD